jgi:hypothetical protein
MLKIHFATIVHNTTHRFTCEFITPIRNLFTDKGRQDLIYATVAFLLVQIPYHCYTNDLHYTASIIVVMIQKNLKVSCVVFRSELSSNNFSYKPQQWVVWE